MVPNSIQKGFDDNEYPDVDDINFDDDTDFIDRVPDDFSH